ncbi:long-chain acyl-CoA synthetase [Microcella putealis]|uniref:Long-chain-fatty-acid--CoA ligase n=1 Tax=Microcella putealis TaxID=337005 RepID=A0A4V2EXH9_9MICO|nr:AMP-binding protein [Microcella putealis]RZS59550.1 long-chain acyl-CoA synthetase [Microcella putealis]TQM26663.1 long-chain acyl-CoA synthetase [Microcella putealis]
MTQRPWLDHYPTGVEHELVAPPFRHMPDLLTAACTTYAKQIAFTQCMPNGMNGSLTYAEIDAHSDAFAAYLREELKLEAGDRVAVQMPNCLAFPIVAFGVFKAGCVLVNTNPLYTASEMTHQFSDSGAKVLVIIDMFADRLPEVVAATPIQTVVTVRISEFFPKPVAGVIRLVQKVWNRSLPKIEVEHTAFQAALARGRAQTGKAEHYLGGVTLDSIAALQYTGGTTGVSKGAMLTHGNLVSNTLQMLQMLGTNIREGKEIVLTALPLYHIFAFTVNLIGFFHMGARNILVPSPRPPGNLKRAFENYKITWTTGVNTLFNALLNERWFVDNPPRHLVGSAAGGMALHESVAVHWREVTDTPIVEGYGLTETSPVLTFNPLGGQVKDGTIGIPVPSTDIRCVKDDGTDAAVGEPGELVARGPQIMKGYWQRPEETAESMLDGWFRTGDIAEMDAEGYFTIVDRKKDMVLVSGFNVFPNEVEERIAAMDGVLEVGVVGIPDEKTGEAVRAYVVAGEKPPTPEQIIAHCRESLAAYKVPKSVRFVDELPKSPIGKILRRELRAEAVTSETASIETQGRELS